MAFRWWADDSPISVVHLRNNVSESEIVPLRQIYLDPRMRDNLGLGMGNTYHVGIGSQIDSDSSWASAQSNQSLRCHPEKSLVNYM